MAVIHGVGAEGEQRGQRPIGCHFEYGSSIVRAAARSGSVEIS
jgi:hypothetical protein